MNWDDELNERKKKILKAIIDDYINFAQPIGSRTIAKKNELNLSSATIRNEMSDLEELGYIVQPHTSAGRIPSNKGYRFYVDNLMKVSELAREEIDRIKDAMEYKINELNELIQKASSIISSVTGYTSIAISPQLNKVTIKAIQVVPLENRKALIVVVTSGGIVKNTIVAFENSIRADELIRMSNIFNEKLRNLSLEEIKLPLLREIKTEAQASDNIILPIINGIALCVKEIDCSQIFMDGSTNIFNYPEFYDIIKARELLEFLNEKEVLSQILRKASAKKNIAVQIGDENEVDIFKDCSLVTTNYSIDNIELGAFGVIGPTRMEYAKVVSSIAYVKRLLDRELGRMFGLE